MAFFPCTRFEDQIVVFFKGNSPQMANWTIEKKLEYDIKLHNELHSMYLKITQLALIAYRKGLRMVIENPRGTLHYLTRYWPLEPSYIDRDRTQRGDYYKKPTQYWFINCDPEHNYIFEAQTINKLQTKGATTIKYMCSSTFSNDTGIKIPRHIARSMIHPDYANRFIREFILDEVPIN